jgi:NAD-specific glutamate dehydrogenase
MMNFDVFFSDQDRLLAIDTAKQMVFLPENCYFLENAAPNISFYQNHAHEIFAKVIVSYQNCVTEDITEKTFTLKFHDHGAHPSWEYTDNGLKDSWIV